MQFDLWKLRLSVWCWIPNTFCCRLCFSLLKCLGWLPVIHRPPFSSVWVWSKHLQRSTRPLRWRAVAVTGDPWQGAVAKPAHLSKKLYSFLKSLGCHATPILQQQTMQATEKEAHWACPTVDILITSHPLCASTHDTCCRGILKSSQ